MESYGGAEPRTPSAPGRALHGKWSRISPVPHRHRGDDEGAPSCTQLCIRMGLEKSQGGWRRRWGVSPAHPTHAWVGHPSLVVTSEPGKGM